MRVCVGSDDDVPLVDELIAYLRSRGDEVIRVAVGKEWPEVGQRVGEAVASGACVRGIVCCSTGTGVAIAANKVPGVRAALCERVETAEGSRRWNDANVLAIGLDYTTKDLGEALIDAFFATEPELTGRAATARLDPMGAQ